MAYDYRTDPEWIEEQGKMAAVQPTVEAMHTALVTAMKLNEKLTDEVGTFGDFDDTVGHIYFRLKDALSEVDRLYAEADEAREAFDTIKNG